MKSYLKTLSLLERDLDQLELQSPLVYQSADNGIQLCRDALHSTRGQVIKNGFKNLQQEFPERLYLEERSGKLGLGTAYIHGFKYALMCIYIKTFRL